MTERARTLRKIRRHGEYRSDKESAYRCAAALSYRACPLRRLRPALPKGEPSAKENVRKTITCLGGYKKAKKILVVGGGGREHAIIKALKKSPDCGEVWCAPGNGGIGYDAHCVNIKATDVETMVGFAETEKV